MRLIHARTHARACFSPFSVGGGVCDAQERLQHANHKLFTRPTLPRVSKVSRGCITKLLTGLRVERPRSPPQPCRETRKSTCTKSWSSEI